MVTGFAETPDRPRNGTKEGAIRRYLVVSTLSNYAGQIVTTGVWFALTPFVLHRLGPTQYGLWALVASFVAYGQLLDFGIGAAVASRGHGSAPLRRHRKRGSGAERPLRAHRAQDLQSPGRQARDALVACHLVRDRRRDPAPR